MSERQRTGCGILLELAHAFSGAAVPPPIDSLRLGHCRGTRVAGVRVPGKQSSYSRRKDHPRLELRRHSSRWALRKTLKCQDRSAPPSTPQYRRWRLNSASRFVPTAHPEAGHYYRSDHFSLARVGIPAFSINEGIKYKGHDDAWGLQRRMSTPKSIIPSPPAWECWRLTHPSGKTGIVSPRIRRVKSHVSSYLVHWAGDYAFRCTHSPFAIPRHRS